MKKSAQASSFPTNSELPQWFGGMRSISTPKPAYQLQKVSRRELAMINAMKILSTFAAAGALLASSFAATANAADTPVQTAMGAAKYKCSAPNQDSMTDVTVAALPIVSNAALFAANDKGLFKKHGLNVEFQTLSNIPATVSAVQGGAVNFAFTSLFAVFQALDRKIPLTIVAPFAGIAPGFWDKMQAGVPGFTREVSALLVAPNSAIKTPGDLNGKTVAVGDVKGQAELATRYVIKSHGGNPDSVKYVVMGFADAINALMAGQVDAAYSAEPAMTKAEQAGYKIISWVGVETFKEGPVSAMIASSDFVLENVETVARFNCVVREATALGRAEPDLIRATTAKMQNVDPATLAKAVVPYFFGVMDMAGLERFYMLEKEAKFITSDLNLNEYVIPQAIKE
ncbi:ABC transporter substrate-binding protein [Agrobacterium tumefaciens]|uniref:ABC transporter substrate-binding protein n=1 Tax=Agrobacterium tumefaciens TaxID=358 RepID=UPI001885F928